MTFTLAKSNIVDTMPSIPKLLTALPNLRTIQILSCKIPGDLKAVMSCLALPTVRVLVLPSDANSLVKACPNVHHVRCAGGNGSALIGALKGTKCEILDGMIDWVKDLKLVDRTCRGSVFSPA